LFRKDVLLEVEMARESHMEVGGQPLCGEFLAGDMLFSRILRPLVSCARCVRELERLDRMSIESEQEGRLEALWEERYG